MVSENVFLFHALLMGFFITFLYDWIRVFRRVCPHASFFISLEDLVFWIYCAGAVFMLLYRESNGNLRWFAIAGAMSGMLLYKKCISAFFVKYMSILIGWLLVPIKKVFGWLLFPIKKLFSCVKRWQIHFVQKIRFHKDKRKNAPKKRLTFFRKMLRITL